jgi:uncharacterized GH25 family protein
VRTNFLRLTAAAAIVSSAVWAHYTWVMPAATVFEAGKPNKITVAHGHRFPQSEEAITASQVKLYVLAPSGAKTDLKAASAGTSVTADFTPKESGPHRIIFTQDRGAMSRTPKGVKPGGRDKNPDATEAFSLLRTGVVYSGKGHKPAGLDAELSAEPAANGSWQVQLLRTGKPVAGQTIQVVLNGQKDATDVGKTGADGKVTFKPAAASKAPVMFLAEFAEKAGAGSSIDERRFSVTLYVNW